MAAKTLEGVNKTNLADFSKLAESFPANDKESLSLIGCNHHSFYHISDCLRPVIREILDRTLDPNQPKATRTNDPRGFIS